MYPMAYALAVYLALITFVLGLAYKVSTWFRYRIGADADRISAATRVAAAARGVILTLFSRKVFTLFRVFVLDILLQVRVFREDRLRWAMHFPIVLGFMGLLLLHALDRYVSAALFPDYQSTLNPFLILRDLFALLVILGLGVAVYRRWILKVPRSFTHVQDAYAIAILGVIMLSGILLHASKIVSYSRYEEMVREYTINADEQELKALEAYWVDKYGVVSPNVKGPFDAEVLEQGKLLNELSCLQCHSRPQWAFLSYGTARLVSLVSPALDTIHLPAILWHIHFLACLLGLAYLPFSKMFHMFATPLSLLANSVMDRETSDPANILTRQVIELDACMHCGTCTSRCSVGVIFEAIPNRGILPSEKIGPIRAVASGRTLSPGELRVIQEGMYLCTNCYRCTVVCPAGINLQDLWFSARESLLRRGQPAFLALSPFSLYRGLMSETLERGHYGNVPDQARQAVVASCNGNKAVSGSDSLIAGDRDVSAALAASVQGNTFSHCYRCVTCSNACPVVRNYPKAQETLGLLPHQIMHAVGMRFWDVVFSARMLWDCLGCYQCQEHCPQGVCVADVLYELKSVAIARTQGRLSEIEREG
jgi:heterodisulfide reductase subunit C